MIRQSIHWTRLAPIFLAAVLLAYCNRQEPADEGFYRAVDELCEALSAKIKRF